MRPFLIIVFLSLTLISFHRESIPRDIIGVLRHRLVVSAAPLVLLGRSKQGTVHNKTLFVRRRFEKEEGTRRATRLEFVCMVMTMLVLGGDETFSSFSCGWVPSV